MKWKTLIGSIVLMSAALSAHAVTYDFKCLDGKKKVSLTLDFMKNTLKVSGIEGELTCKRAQTEYTCTQGTNVVVISAEAMNSASKTDGEVVVNHKRLACDPRVRSM